MEPYAYEERGYLKEPFRLFHLSDNEMRPVDYHYHTFHKLILLLDGHVGYAVEGERYELQPGDFVLVGSGSIHRPEVAGSAPYERMILYISPEFLQQRSTDSCDLETCFHRAQQKFHYVYRSASAGRLRTLLTQLELAHKEDGFGVPLMEESLFLQLMVTLNRVTAQDHLSAADCDEKIVAILRYLNSHLTEPVSIDELAAQFYLSKFHMMRRFKEETGYSIHRYVTEKRLLLSRQLLFSGCSVTESCARCGYADYSAFARAYKKQFGLPPSETAR